MAPVPVLVLLPAIVIAPEAVAKAVPFCKNPILDEPEPLLPFPMKAILPVPVAVIEPVLKYKPILLLPEPAPPVPITVIRPEVVVMSGVPAPDKTTP